MKRFTAALIAALVIICAAASAEVPPSAYNSFEDTTCWNYSYVIKETAVYSIHTESDWGDVNQKSYIHKSDIADLNKTETVYGPIRGRFNYLMDGGDELLFVKDAKNGQVLYSLSYKNESAKRVTKFDKGAGGFIRVGDELYYTVRKTIHSYNLKTGGKKRLYKSSDKPLDWQPLQYAYGRLYFAKMDYEPVKNGDKRGIHSLELSSGKVRRLTYGKVYPFAILGQALYTYNDGDKLAEGTIRVDLDGSNAEKISDELYYFDQAHEGILLAGHRKDTDTVNDTLFALSNKEPLFEPKTNKSLVLKGATNFLLGDYCVRVDTDGTSDRYTAIPIGEVAF